MYPDGPVAFLLRLNISSNGNLNGKIVESKILFFARPLSIN